MIAKNTIRFLCGVFLLSFAAWVIFGSASDANIGQLPGIFLIAIALSVVPFLVAILLTRPVRGSPLVRSSLIWSIVGVGSAVALFLVLSSGEHGLPVHPSEWLLCLPLGLAGLGIGALLHRCEDALTKAWARRKVRHNGA